MDTAEAHEIKQAQKHGHPETDEGPYYHDAWWESYKGSVKGKLGGAVIGAGMGAVIGVAATMMLPIFGGVALGAAAVAMTVSGFSAAGLMYGAHEFADVGRVTGAVAAGLETAEKRGDVKLARLENKIDQLQSKLTGEPIPEDSKAAQLAAQEGTLDYKTTHCDDHGNIMEKPKLVFWKVALVGLAIGLAAGAILASGGIAGHILGALGVAAEGGALGTLGTYAASMLTMGLFGASFGINRDIFRDVFDRTDMMFRGIIGKSKINDAIVEFPPPLKAVAIEKAPEKPVEKQDNGVNTVMYTEPPQQSKPETYHRDKVVASAKQALLNMDHTKAIQH